jgi:hypothetical protein
VVMVMFPEVATWSELSYIHDPIPTFNFSFMQSQPSSIFQEGKSDPRALQEHVRTMRQEQLSLGRATHYNDSKLHLTLNMAMPRSI